MVFTNFSGTNIATLQFFTVICERENIISFQRAYSLNFPTTTDSLSIHQFSIQSFRMFLKSYTENSSKYF